MIGAHNTRKTASFFMLRGIQEWGQSEAERIAATQALITAAGFSATANGSIVFGRIISKPLTGPDAAKATAWLDAVLETMERGKFENEVEHIERALNDRAKATA